MALRRLAVGAATLSAARMVQTALGFLSLPLLARLLAPSEFGVVALAMSFVLFTLALADAGMGQSLVRTPALERDTWSSAFWVISGLSGCLSLFLVAIAWPAAWILDTPALAPLIWALAPVPLIQGMAAAHVANLQQRERFPILAAAEIGGAVAGISTAVILALSGYGAWALVGQQLALWIVKGSVVWLASSFRPRLGFRREGLEPHIRFGAHTAGWSLVNFFSRQIDPMVIAKLLGAAFVGYYAVANRLMTLPGHLVAGPVQNALYTRMVVLRDDLPALKSLVLIASRSLAGFVFVPMAIVAVAAPALVALFLSERWLDVAPLLTAMAPVGALQAVTGLNGAILMATGRTDLRLRLTIEFTLLWLIALPVLASFGLLVIAIGYSTVFLLYLPRTCKLFLSPIGCSRREYVAALAGPAIIAFAAAAVHLVLKLSLSPSAIDEVVMAGVEIAAAYGVMGWAMRDVFRSDLRKVRSLFASISTPILQK